MPITVVCPGCKKRFAVNDRYAGQKGPCPSCKTVIQIPSKADEVVIHAPEAAGPKDSKGTAVLKPILRQETAFSGTMAGVIGGAVVLIFVIAWVVGSFYNPEEKGKPSNIPLPLKALAALALGPPLAASAYSFLRNDELEPYRGKELWIRVLACGVVYAALWGVYSMAPYALAMDRGFQVFELLYVVPPLVAIGAFAAYASLELDFLTGAMHYGLYLIVTVVLRVVAGMNAF